MCMCVCLIVPDLETSRVRRPRAELAYKKKKNTSTLPVNKLRTFWFKCLDRTNRCFVTDVCFVCCRQISYLIAC